MPLTGIEQIAGKINRTCDKTGAQRGKTLFTTETNNRHMWGTLGEAEKQTVEHIFTGDKQQQQPSLPLDT